MLKSRHKRLTNPQFNALHDGSLCKFYRSARGFIADLDPDKPARLYDKKTIKSLCDMGLMDTNFDDPIVFTGVHDLSGCKNNDGAKYDHSPDQDILNSWTNDKGKAYLWDHYKNYINFLNSRANRK